VFDFACGSNDAFWTGNVHGKLDLPPKLRSNVKGRKFPNDVVEYTPKVMDDFSSKHAEPGKVLALQSVFAEFIKRTLIRIGETWIAALPSNPRERSKKGHNLGIEITDVLVGPL
jgi:hypothetical protein